MLSVNGVDVVAWGCVCPGVCEGRGQRLRALGCRRWDVLPDAGILSLGTSAPSLIPSSLERSPRGTEQRPLQALFGAT